MGSEITQIIAVDNENDDQTDSDGNGEGDACDAMPATYSAIGYFGEDGASGVSYTGQTARQVLQLGLVDAMEGLVERPETLWLLEASWDFSSPVTVLMQLHIILRQKAMIR
jgi:hypothetical protein